MNQSFNEQQAQIAKENFSASKSSRKRGIMGSTSQGKGFKQNLYESQQISDPWGKQPATTDARHQKQNSNQRQEASYQNSSKISLQ